MGELLVPRRGIEEGGRLLEAVIGSLPLSDCTLERDPVSGLTTYVAPDGFEFIMEGKFILNCDLGNDLEMYLCAPSQAVVDDDPSERVLEDYDDEIEYPVNFTGKRVLVSLEGSKDHWQSLDVPRKSDDDRPIVSVRLLAQPSASYSNGVRRVEVDAQTMGTAEPHRDYEETSLAFMRWIVKEATGEFGTCQLSLVPVASKSAKLVVVREDRVYDTLWHPDENAKMTPEEYARDLITDGYYGQVARMHGHELTDDDIDGFVTHKARELREAREFGLPYPGDPLANFLLAIGETVESIDMSEVINPSRSRSWRDFVPAGEEPF